LVGKIFDYDQQLDRPLFLGKCRERAQEITIFKGGVLPAFNAGQLFLDDLRQRVILTPPLRRARSLRKRADLPRSGAGTSLTARSSISWGRSSACSRS